MSKNADSSTPVLSCHSLTKSFVEGDRELQVLQDIDLEIGRGDLIAIVGASGSGKTTLLQLLGGLDAPTSGNVRILGQNLADLDEHSRGILRNQSIGFVYQFHHLLAEFSALENVALPLLVGRQSPDLAERKASELLDRVGLGDRLSHKPGQLSGGERQRAAVARALISRPALVLADEPTGNLDGRTGDQVFDLMLELNQELETSFVVVTHDPSIAARMDRILSLEDGQLVPGS